ncbi:hypothetical protein LOK49_LG04G01942 [Camellia lanceoleosa]|uniref:Uncharacterized protein n=1 Tax=Camellia lanceoleosa TaxID=1840588 RepID=A0ACC0I1N6_9ERIC|nr:hypothetical protein LOK49_LG04G01942 [Camellia lanceoleosa]
MVSGVSRKRSTASNKRRARQTEPEPVEVNVPVEEDDHVDANNDYVDDDIGVEDDDVDNDISFAKLSMYANIWHLEMDDDDVADVDQAEEVLTGSFPGGPSDPSVLKSFKAHIATAIWKQNINASELLVFSVYDLHGVSLAIQLVLRKSEGTKMCRACC